MNIEENKEDEITDSVNKYYQLKMKIVLFMFF